jgi:hypothetical protein
MSSRARPARNTGATLTTAMTHIAIQESLNGKNVEWLEHVSDEQYLSTAVES